MKTSNPGGVTSSASWTYDNRGRTASASYSAAGVGPYTYSYAYDSGDRVLTMTYPSSEQVSYTYDDAWRQTSACSSLGPCYVSGGLFSSANQPTIIPTATA